MRKLKCLFIVIIALFQCYICQEVYKEQSGAYYYDTVKEWNHLSIRFTQDTPMEKKSDVIADITKKKDIVMFSAFKKQHTMLYVYSDIDTWLKNIISSSDIGSFRQGKSIIAHTGDHREHETYEMKDFRFAKMQDVTDLSVYTEHIAVLEDIQSRWNSDEMMDVDLEANTMTVTDTNEISPTMMSALPYFLIMNIIFLSISLLKLSFDEKKNSIAALLGISDGRRIVRDLFLTIGSYFIAMTMAVLLSLKFLYMDWNRMEYWRLLCLSALLQCSAFAIIYGLLWMVLRKQNIQGGLFQDSENTYLFFVIFGIKTIVLVLLVQISATTCSTLRLYWGQHQMAAEFLTKAENLVQMDDMNTDAIDLNREETANSFNDTQAVLGNSNAIYIEAIRLAYDYESDPNEEIFYDLTAVLPNAIRVNDACLAYFTIKDENGNPLDDTQKNRLEEPMVYRPEAYWDENVMQEIQENPAYQRVAFQKIANGQKGFSYHPKVATAQQGYLEDVIFVLDGNTNLNFYFIDVAQEKGASVKAKFEHWKRRQGLPNVSFFKEPKNDLAAIGDELWGKTIKSLLQFGLLLLSLGVLSFQYIYVYIKVNQKKLFLSKILGSSYTMRYFNVLLYILCCYMTAQGILFVQRQFIYMPCIVFILGLDAVISMLCIRMLENAAIVAMLKGES